MPDSISPKLVQPTTLEKAWRVTHMRFNSTIATFSNRKIVNYYTKETATVPKRSLISRLFMLGVSTVAISYVNLSPLTGQAATYDYMAPQVAPPIASGLIMPQIETILNQAGPAMPYIDAYQQTTVDANGVVAGLA